MNKEITYSGYAVNTPGYNCPDGEFDAVMDLWHEHGAFRPVLSPSVVLSLSAGQKVVYIHKPKAGTTNYILFVTETVQGVTYYRVYWGTSAVNMTMLASASSISATYFKSVTAIGNTLILLTEAGMMYYLWKGASSASTYLYLGNHIPELQLSFGLQGTFYQDSSNVISGMSSYSSQYPGTFYDDDVQKVTQSVLSNVNKFIADKGMNNGKFIMPFLVRYAYRLYDGSLVMHSAPVLMLTADKTTPRVDSWGINNSEHTLGYRVYGIAYDLDYQTLINSQKTALRNWSDIVRSVDIFISAPLTTYDQSGEVKGMSVNDHCYGICKWINAPHDIDDIGQYYQRFEFAKMRLWNSLSYTSQTINELILPSKGEKSLKNQVDSCGNFYLLKSINVSELATSRTKIDIDGEYLQSLVNRERMTDDYDSHDTLIPRYPFGFNQRLNLANLDKTLFSGFHPQQMLQFSNGYNSISTTGEIDSSENSVWKIHAYITVKRDNKDFIVSATDQANNVSLDGVAFVGNHTEALPCLIFHPDVCAQKVTLKLEHTNQISYRDHPMQEHGFLTAAIDKEDNLTAGTIVQTAPSVTTNNVISLPNKLYTSEVNNPFYFPATNINTIGVGQIRGISAAAKPMSLGQFGQFPLYIFSTDGIWAMEVSATGGYSAKQPISMEIAKSGTITQLDSAVAFATDRGVLVISGNEVKSISDTIDNGSDSVFLITNANLPQSATVLSADATRLASIVSFRVFLANANTVFDSISQRLIIFSPEYTYAYVYSMDGSGRWGMMRSNIISAVNSYPNACAMTSNNKLIDLSYRGANTSHAQLAVTRPLKLDYPNALKRITSIIQRGNFSKRNGTDAVQCVLYGSRNLVNWFAVWSSTDRYLRGMHGTAYKYYRILLKCSLLDSESISGCSVEFEPDLTDQPR